MAKKKIDWEVLATQMPDEVLKKEHARRFGTGRPRVMKGCPHCGGEFSSREIREHIPRCTVRFEKKLALLKALESK